MPGTGYYYPTEVLTKYGASLRRPHGRVLFAGSERAMWGTQWMEGRLLYVFIARPCLTQKNRSRSQRQRGSGGDSSSLRSMDFSRARDDQMESNG